LKEVAEIDMFGRGRMERGGTGSLQKYVAHRPRRRNLLFEKFDSNLTEESKESCGERGPGKEIGKRGGRKEK